jgi:hypothetical protein
MKDPFAPEADPLREEAVPRRAVVLSLAVLPVAAAVVGCIHPAPACPTQEGDKERCRHRFCRYYGG